VWINPYCLKSSSLIAAEVILKANNVIFAKVSARLNFNENHIIGAGRCHAMGNANGDINRSASL
jgi:hypothetical protein